MFALEVFTQIEGVEEVELSALPLWFSQCLALRTKGQGGPVAELSWPIKIVKRRQDAYHKPKKPEITICLY